jgi:regulatory GntR family protein
MTSPQGRRQATSAQLSALPSQRAADDPDECAAVVVEGMPQFAQTPLWVIVKCRKSVWLWDYLSARYGGLGEIFPGYRRLSRDIGVSYNTVRRAADELEAAGALERRVRRDTKGARRSNLYVLKWIEPQVKP